MFFMMSVRLSDHKVLHNIASSSSFRFRSDFLAFFARIPYFKFLEFKEFNKTIMPFVFVGYETGYSQLGATRLVPYLPGSLRNHDDDGNNNVTNFAYLIVKNNSFARFARAVFIFDISQTFSFFLRREMTCFAVVLRT